MRTFAISDTQDLILGSDARITMRTDLYAVLDVCKGVMLAQVGEQQYAMDEGMPDFETVFTRFNPSQFEAAARVTLGKVTGVISVDAFTMTRVANRMIYRATIRTIYGTGEITNG